MRAGTLIALIALAASALGAPARAEPLVVIVNPASKVTSLSTVQVLDIFLGRYRKLPSGIAAMPIDLGPDTPQRREFYLVLAHKDPADMSSYWARVVFSGLSSPPFPAGDEHAALELVASNPSAVAYVARSVVDSRVKVVLELTP